MTVILRPYQEESLKIMENTKIGTPSLIVLPTASGKGTLFAALANKSKGRVLIIVPSGELLDQGISKIQQFDSNADVGKIKASVNQIESKIMVGTRQSLSSKKSTRIEEMIKHGNIEYVILDEVHNAVEQLEGICKKLKNVKIIGMTATPYNIKIKRIFKTIDYQKSILDMITDGYLSEPKAIIVQSTTSLNSIKMVAGDFKQDELERTVNNLERNRTIVQAYKEYAFNRNATIVFCTGIDHCRDLKIEFEIEGISCGSIDSNMSKMEREGVIHNFETGKIKVLLNVNILSTGYDLPKIDCVIMAKPTRSKIYFIQCLGRGLRLHSDKDDCLLIDVADSCRVHDLMSISSVFDMPIKHGETPKKAIERNKKEKIEEEVRKAEEEKKRIEREKMQLEEVKIKAEQIKLFNRDMKTKIDKAKLDWQRADNLTYYLTYAMNLHYAVRNVEDVFQIYNVVTEKDGKYADIITTKPTVTEAIDYVEKRSNKNTYTDKNSDWKFEKPTDNQLKYCNWGRTKWECACYFTGSSIKTILNKKQQEVNIFG